MDRDGQTTDEWVVGEKWVNAFINQSIHPGITLPAFFTPTDLQLLDPLTFPPNHFSNCPNRACFQTHVPPRPPTLNVRL